MRRCLNAISEAHRVAYMRNPVLRIQRLRFCDHAAGHVGDEGNLRRGARRFRYDPPELRQHILHHPGMERMRGRELLTSHVRAAQPGRTVSSAASEPPMTQNSGPLTAQISTPVPSNGATAAAAAATETICPGCIDCMSLPRAATMRRQSRNENTPARQAGSTRQCCGR